MRLEHVGKPVSLIILLTLFGLVTVAAEGAGYSGATHQSTVNGAYAWSTDTTANITDTRDDGHRVYALYYRKGDSKQHRLGNGRGVNRTTSTTAKVEAIKACVARDFRPDSCGDYG